MLKEGMIKGIYVLRLEEGADLLGEITRIAREEHIGSGILMAIGALGRASFGFYAGAKEGYKVVKLDRHLELLSCVGNISLMGDSPLVHAHICVGDEEGRTYGGHLMDGCVVSPTAELHILRIVGLSFRRRFDSKTGLALLSAEPEAE